MRSPSDRRLRLIGGSLALALTAILARAYHLQITEHAHLSRLSQEQYLAHVKIPARRGHIVDQSGSPLAITVDVPSVFANPAAISDVPHTAELLAPLLHMTPAAIAQRLGGGRYFVWLKRHVTAEVGARVRALRIAGIGLTDEPQRAYPNRETAAHLLGVAGLDGHGLEGIEKQLDHELLGAPQMVRALRDARGRSVLAAGAGGDLRARGSEVTLTIDLQIEHMAEQALARAVATTGAQAASAVVVDVHSGDILALAMAPAFDPADSANVEAGRRRARVLTDMIEPGSTLKPLVVGAALDTGAVAPHTRLFCENGRLALRGHTISDTSPHGWLSLTEVIAKSSNIGMAKVSALMGKQPLEFALRRLGFGARSGLGFPGESPGLLRPSASWGELEAATIAFGQGMAVNMVQLAAAYRVLAADGVYREPRLLRQIRRADGSVLPLGEPQERRVMSVDAARRVTRMLEAAITPAGGTGRLAAVPGYRVAGKTGTAQKADAVRRGYSTEKYVAMFAGYLPAESPRVVIVVAVDEPKSNHYGGVVAAPVFSEIGAAAMQRLGVLASAGVAQIPPGPLEAEAMRAAPPKLAGVGVIDATTQSAAVKAVRPVAQARAYDTLPFVGPPAPIAEQGAGVIPAFVGMTAKEAVAKFIAADLPCELILSGSGTVVHQDPAPQTEITDVPLLQLYFGSP